jgi:hypothetical protein
MMAVEYGFEDRRDIQVSNGYEEDVSLLAHKSGFNEIYLIFLEAIHQIQNHRQSLQP